jgi:hypothetical protein
MNKIFSSNLWIAVLLLVVVGASFYAGYSLNPQYIIQTTNAISYTDIIQTIIQFIGLFSLIFIWRDRIDNDRWNKLRETLTLTWTTPYLKLREKIISLERSGKINRDQVTITEGEMSNLTKDEEIFIKDFLDHLEEICTGYLLNAFDKKYFQSIWSAIMIKNYRYFEKFILAQRIKQNQNDLYSDMQKVTTEFLSADMNPEDL